MTQDTKTIGFIAVILVLIFAIAFLLAQKGGVNLQQQECNELKNGSTALAFYTVGVVSPQGVTILDTNVEEEAVKSRIYNPVSVYKPSNITVGSGTIEGVSEAMIGMKKGEEKIFAVPPQKAYGEIDQRLREVVANSDLAKLGIESLAVNMQVTTQNGNARVVSFNETHALLDYNPALAGQTLVYKVKVLDFKC